MFKIASKGFYDDEFDPIEEDDAKIESLDYDGFLIHGEDFDLDDEIAVDEVEVTEFGILGDLDFEELEIIDDSGMIDIEGELSLLIGDSPFNTELLEEMSEQETLMLKGDSKAKVAPKKKRKTSDAVVIDSMRKYQKDVSKYELLTREEEVALARRWRDHQDQDAFHKLIVSNLRLVISIAQKYRNNGLDFNEIIQEGNIGLIRALERYDPEAGYRISTYATWWIRQCIVRGLADKSRHIRLPVHVNEKVIKINKVKALLQKKLYRTPTPEEMLPFLGSMSLEEIKNVMDSVKDVSSLNINVGDDGNSTISDFIEDKSIKDPASEITRKNLKNVLTDIIGELPPRERYIIERRFNLDGSKNQTLEEIGAVLGVTRERVRQLEVKGLKILKEKMDERDMNRGDFV